jgi:hypothetical protein
LQAIESNPRSKIKKLRFFLCAVTKDCAVFTPFVQRMEHLLSFEVDTADHFRNPPFRSAFSESVKEEISKILEARKKLVAIKKN